MTPEKELREQMLAIWLASDMRLHRQFHWSDQPRELPHTTYLFKRNAMRNIVVVMDVRGEHAKVGIQRTFPCASINDTGLTTREALLRLMAMEKEIELLRDFARREWDIT